MDILIKNLEPEYAPSEGEHEGKIVRLRIFSNGRVDFINPYNEACIKTEAEAVVLPEHGDLIDKDTLRKSFENQISNGSITVEDIFRIIDDSAVVLERTT